jgi:uncharacterized protein
MTSSLQPIYLPQLAKALDRTLAVEVEEYLADLDTLTPVQGRVQIVHQGNYLEVTGQAETIVTLVCDRCLQQYNHRLRVDCSEMIWLKHSPDEFQPLEQELEYEELVESLPPEGYFDPGGWLYEHLCLELPQQQLCQADCAGLQIQMDRSSAVDQRWALLEKLRDQLPQSSMSED